MHWYDWIAAIVWFLIVVVFPMYCYLDSADARKIRKLYEHKRK